MAELRTRMGAGGRVVVPARLRKAMGVEEGDELILVETKEGGVLLLTSEQAARRAQALVAKYVPRRRRLARELVAERRAEAAGG